MGVRLPAEYQEVEYLESDKNSYIDTGVIFSEANYTVLTDIMLLASQDTNLFGMRGYSSGNHSAFVVGAKNAGIKSGTNWQILNNASSWHYSTNKDVFQNQKYSIKYQYNNTGVLLNVDDIDQIVLSFTPRWNDFVDLPMYLFVQNSGYREVRADECYKMRCYSFIVNRNNVTVLNLIPCYRKADSKPGMYDLVTNQFFTNAGTGDFLVGPDVLGSISPLMVAWRRAMMALVQSGGGPLPNGYRRVEYLESYKSQSWLKIEPEYATIVRNDIFTVWFNMLEYNNKLDALAGGNTWELYFNSNPPRSNIWYGFDYYDPPSAFDVSLNTKTKWAVKANANRNDIFLFTFRSSASYPFTGRIYSVTLERDGNKVLDLIPCVRISDGVPGMYEVVQGGFFPSATGTPFIVPTEGA